MPRGRLSRNGIALAKVGYDVDTAPLTGMQFSPQLVAKRLAYDGTVVVGAHSDGVPFSSYYKATKVHDPQYQFPDPPEVRVAGINGDGTSDLAPYVINYAGNGQLWVLPYFVIYSYIDRFDLYVLREADRYVGPLTWKFFVFHNTLSG